MTTDRQHRIDRDLRFMNQPRLWPMRVLPMKKHIMGERFPRLGVVLPDDLTTVHLIQPHEAAGMTVDTIAKSPGIERERFSSTLALLQAEWMVD